MHTIVGIHGLANKSEKDVLAKAWKQSIDEGLEKNPNADKADYEYVSVHWADLLYMHAKPTIYERMKRGTFPRPIPLGGEGRTRGVGWLKSEIDLWVTEQAGRRPGGV